MRLFWPKNELLKYGKEALERDGKHRFDVFAKNVESMFIIWNAVTSGEVFPGKKIERRRLIAMAKKKEEQKMKNKNKKKIAATS